MILRDEQVSSAVVVVVTGNDGSRIFELNLIEADVSGDIFEAIGPEVAEKAHFSFFFFGFAYGDEVDPAVVVVVEGGDAVGADPVGFGESYLLESLAVIVAPEGQGRGTIMRKREVHPAIVVEVERHNSARW